MNDNDLTWRKSRRSGQFNNCIEVAKFHGGTAVRDSKDPSGPALPFSAASWAAFTAGVRAGDFE